MDMKIQDAMMGWISNENSIKELIQGYS